MVLVALGLERDFWADRFVSCRRFADRCGPEICRYRPTTHNRRLGRLRTCNHGDGGHSYDGHHPPSNNHSNVERTSTSTLGAQLINDPDRLALHHPGLGQLVRLADLSRHAPDRRPGRSRWRLLRQGNVRNVDTPLTVAPRVRVFENLGIRGEYKAETMFPNRRPRLAYLAEIALGHLEDFRRHWKDGSENPPAGLSRDTSKRQARDGLLLAQRI
jgi:hypothetical protein